MTTALLLDILDKHLKEAQTIYIAGWSSPVARRAHNPKVVSSNLAPATINPHGRWLCGFFLFPSTKDTLEKWFVCNSHLFARLLDVLCNFI